MVYSKKADKYGNIHRREVLHGRLKSPLRLFAQNFDNRQLFAMQF